MASDTISNKTFDELAVGDQASLTRTLSYKDIELFAAMSGDVNPAMVDAEYARSDMFHKLVAHGMWGGALISAVLGTALPGPGTIYTGQTLRFTRPVALGDTVTVTVTVTAKDAKRHRVTLDCNAANQNGETVISGTAEVIAPTEKIIRPRKPLPDVKVYERGRRYRELLALTADLEPVRTAVVHPVDTASLTGAVEAAREGLIEPVLVGPGAKIRAAAQAASMDLGALELVESAHSHDAAAKAVELVRAGEAHAIMKGALHTDELMHAVLAHDAGLRTERRVSHVFAIDVPTYPRALFVTDAAINVAPDLTTKRDIAQNAIDLAHALGIERPKLAVLSAVETVNPAIPSTLDAAALCKMADRGQITGAIVDGPFAFDNAVSKDAAKTKGISSPVAGQADILLVPDLEAGNMLAKQLEYLADAQVAGIAVGARVPIVLTSRADGTLARLASCAIAMLLVHRHRAHTS